MDIKKCRIDMMVRTKLGKTGKIKEITRDRAVIDLLDGSDYGAAFNCIEPVSDPCEGCQKLEQTRLKAFWEGRAAEKEATENAMNVLRKDRDNYKRLSKGRGECIAVMWADLEKEKLKAFQEGEKAADKKIASMDESCGYWKAACEEARRNAAYWREELEKLQKEALVDSKSLAEVAKIYIQVSPEVLDRILKGSD